jgi:hypothetical protein
MKNYKKAFAIFWIAAFLAIPAFMWAAETWNETTPSGSESPTLGDDRIRELKRAIRERLAVDHDFEASESPAFGDANATIGMHEGIRLKEQASSPTTIADQAGFWAADDGSGNTELFMRGPSDASAVQLTESNCGKIKSEAVDFSKEGTFTITDTTSGVSSIPLIVFGPNVSDGGSVYARFGKAASNYDSALLTFYHASAGNTANRFDIGLYASPAILRLDGSGNAGVGAASDGDKLYVSGTGEYTDTLTLSKGSGNGLVVASDVDFNGNQDVAGTSNIHDTLTLSKASGTGLSVASNVVITGSIDFNNIESGATKDEINARCDGVPNYSTDDNSSPVTVTSGGVQAATLDLGTVTAGDVFFIEAQFTYSKGATGGKSNYYINQASGTATIAFPPSAIATSHNDAASITYNRHFGGMCFVTGSGTLVMQMGAFSDGSNSSISSGACDLAATFIKKQ